MSYSHPLRISYNFGSVAFSSGSSTRNIAVPAGKRFAKIREIHLDATVTFNAVTTPAKIQVGNGTTANKYADFSCATTAAGAAKAMASSDVVAAYREFIDCGSAGENLTALKVSLIANTGGTPAGTGVPTIVIDWY